MCGSFQKPQLRYTPSASRFGPQSTDLGILRHVSFYILNNISYGKQLYYKYSLVRE